MTLLVLLLIGCGELGSRHLQALASLPSDIQSNIQIEVLDSRPEALDIGRQKTCFLLQVTTSSNRPSYPR